MADGIHLTAHIVMVVLLGVALVCAWRALRYQRELLALLAQLHDILRPRKEPKP